VSTTAALTASAAATLRSSGLNVTAQRLAVFEVVSAHPHTTADSVLDAVRTNLGTISRQAVYDSLAVLVDAGILRRIEPAGSPARYETRVGDNHHHVVCRDCGALADVDCAVAETPCLTAAHDQGFRIDEAEVTYWGICAACIAQSDTSLPPKTNKTTETTSNK